MSRLATLALLVLTLTGCVTGEPFLTKDARLKDGKEYRLEIGGEFKKPEGKGPFPTIIILQSCGGSAPALYGWASEFRDWGYATFLVKSLEARGMQVCQHPFSRTMMNMDVASDAFGALEYLASKPEVDKKKIVVVGFSLGAGAINDYIVSKPNPPGAVDFAGAISFYQRCDQPMRALARYPILEFAASLDSVHYPTCALYKQNWASLVTYEPMVAKNLDNLTIVKYENVHHSFDDNRFYSPKSDIGGNTMLYDRKAHLDSIEKVREFLKKVMGH